MTIDEMDRKNAELGELIETRLGFSGRDLGQRVRRAGRALPRWARRDMARFQSLDMMARHPKLRHQVDPAEVAAIHERVGGYLEGIDPRERRITRLLGILASVAFVILLTLALFVTVARWRGLV